MRKMMIAAAAALATISTAAVAAVTLNDNGTGFVGKGDVQLAFGHNNNTIQANLIANPQAYTFKFVSEESFAALCEWETVTGGKNSKIIYHDKVKVTSTSVLAAINGAPRQTKGQNQFTGFNLLGWGATTSTGTVPVVGDSCIGDEDNNSSNGNAIGEITEVTPGENNDPGTLYVTFGSQSVAL